MHDVRSAAILALSPNQISAFILPTLMGYDRQVFVCVI